MIGAASMLALVALLVVFWSDQTTTDQAPSDQDPMSIDGGSQGTPSSRGTGRQSPAPPQEEQVKGPEEFLAAGQLPVPPRNRDLLSETGQLTDRAVTRIGLTPEQRVAAQEKLDRYFDAHLKEFQNRIVRNEDLSDEENGIVIYDVPPAEDLGAQAREGLHQDLESLLGRRSTIQIMSKLPVDYFGYFGRLSTRIKFYPNPSEIPSPGDEVRVAYTYYDPSTGKELLNGQCRLPEFYLRFGSSFR